MGWVCSRCGKAYSVGPGRCLDDGARLLIDHSGELIAGRYRLEAPIGAGGMGSAVWRGRQLPAARAVAVKLLPPSDRVGRERFKRGGRIAANLNHPNIATVHDFGEADDGRLFLVMELLNGTELSELLKAEPRLSVERALHIAELTLCGLAHAHRRGVVHRDLKPANLFLVRHAEDSDFVKIIDFGISKLSGAAAPMSLFEAEEELTGSAEASGTPEYMAPEQIRQGEVEPATDLYALGVVMYRMLCGGLPFSGRAQELFEQHLSAAPPPLGCDVPPPLEDFIARALQKNPADRWSSAAEMRAELLALRQQLGLSAVEMTGTLSLEVESLSEAVAPPNPRGRGLRWAALALGVVASFGCAWWLGEREGREAVRQAQRADVQVMIQSDPPGALLTEAGASLGWTPISVRLSEGEHTLRLELPGHEPKLIQLSLQASQPQPVTWRVDLARGPGFDAAQDLAPAVSRDGTSDLQ